MTGQEGLNGDYRLLDSACAGQADRVLRNRVGR